MKLRWQKLNGWPTGCYAEVSGVGCYTVFRHKYMRKWSVKFVGRATFEKGTTLERGHNFLVSMVVGKREAQKWENSRK